MAAAKVAESKPAADAIGTGRRKSSVARVRIRPGSGKITINKRPLEEYFPLTQDQNAVLAPLNDSGNREEVDVLIRANGGGSTGQSGACKMGIARALVAYNEELYTLMREKGHMTRDSRMKERKKPGLHGARRGTQFSKR
jgi:small subunit ribosomal protein S9